MLHDLFQKLPHLKPMWDHNGLVIGTPVSNGIVVISYPDLTLIEFLNDLLVFIASNYCKVWSSPSQLFITSIKDCIK